MRPVALQVQHVAQQQFELLAADEAGVRTRVRRLVRPAAKRVRNEKRGVCIKKKTLLKADFFQPHFDRDPPFLSSYSLQYYHLDCDRDGD